jgi:hypothetical protein
MALFSVSGWSDGGYSDDPSNPKSHFPVFISKNFYTVPHQT